MFDWLFSPFTNLFHHHSHTVNSEEYSNSFPQQHHHSDSPPLLVNKTLGSNGTSFNNLGLAVKGSIKASDHSHSKPLDKESGTIVLMKSTTHGAYVPLSGGAASAFGGGGGTLKTWPTMESPASTSISYLDIKDGPDFPPPHPFTKDFCGPQHGSDKTSLTFPNCPGPYNVNCMLLSL